ncbi:MAG: biotin--[acetyl-CoA-carboxylase] ligase [Rikenellaceae bacterium]|jgi:BirA family biotin operon repressor/biotin-[acetyl-CoA-carboxylase] ligase|nr:biotin--[acetyl-CoA-carboxylase] ligase [Rikenellaceae bacterium]
MLQDFLDFARLNAISATVLELTGSTNDAASDPACRHGDIVVALEQSCGRGQRGNSWSSERGRNLTFSIVLEPENFAAERQFMLSKIVALSIVEVLAKFGVEARIKWPNDIYAGSRKIAGVLIENSVCGAQLTRSIVGIGLNVNQTAFDPALPNPTSVALETGREADLGHLLKELYITLMSMLRRGGGRSVDRLYLEKLYLRGVPHRFTASGRSFEGVIRGVGDYGELLVEQEGGATDSYLFKEIEFERGAP